MEIHRLLLLSAPLLMLHSKLTTVTHISSPHSGQFPPTASTSSGPLVFPSVQTAPGHPESDVILVPFHGLTQCLTYTLIEVLWKVFGWRVEGLEGMARLPEYRSEGLLVVLGILMLKPDVQSLGYQLHLPTTQ